MDYPHPNPHFPKPPRRGSLPWGWAALVFFIIAVGSLIAAVINQDHMTLAMAGTIGGIIVGGLSFSRHARTGGWRSGRIVPAVLYTDSNNAMQLALVDSWWNGKPQQVEISPGQLWKSLKPGDFVWIIKPTNFTTAQFVEIAATDEHSMTPVPPEAEEWLRERLGKDWSPYIE